MRDEHSNPHTDPTADTPDVVLPNVFKRLGMVLFQPGEVFRLLAVRPASIGALAVSMVIIGVATWFLPIEAVADQMRQNAGEGMPEIPDWVMRVITAGTAVIFFPIGVLILTIVTYVIFGFIRGDNVTFRQHLAVITHTSVIGALGNLLLLPLRIRSVDIEQTLSIGSFFRFLPDGFLSNFLGGLDLFAVWGAIVAGLGLSLLDPRRRWRPTAMVMVGLVVVMALFFGWLGSVFGSAFG